MKELVFCKNCLWLKENIIHYGVCVDRKCEHIDNKADVLSYYIYSKEYKKHPKIINKNNDCEWFEKKIGIWKLFCRWVYDNFVRIPGGGPGNP